MRSSQSPILSRVLGHGSEHRWLALSVLATANLGLVLVVSAGFTVLADVAAPLAGHLIGFGLAASLALIVRRCMLTLLAAGIAATVGLHAALGLSNCCAPPRPIAQTGPTKAAAGTHQQRLSLLAFNTWDTQPQCPIGCHPILL